MSLNTEKLNPVIAEFSVELSARLTPVLKEMASRSGWPQHIVDALRVEVGNDYMVHVTHPGISDDEVDVHEYGFKGPVNSVIRVFMNRYKNYASELLAQEFAQKMFDALEVSF
jgi:hypothetical protein